MDYKQHAERQKEAVKILEWTGVFVAAFLLIFVVLELVRAIINAL